MIKYLKWQIALFFIIALGWSGSIWTILIPAVQHKFHLNLSQNLAWLGLIGPGLAAIAVTFISAGWLGIKALFRPLLNWKVGIIYYVFVYAGVFFFYCAASWLTVLFQGYTETHDIFWLIENNKAPFFNLSGIWLLLEITIIYTFCEELGWRGLGLPALLFYMNGLNAALLIGVLWTLWHIPLVYLYGHEFGLATFLIYFTHIVCFSIFYAWLYLKTNFSLLLVGLFHGATDGFGAFFPLTSSLVGQGPNFYTVMMEVLVAALMIPYLFKYRFKST